MIVTSKLRKLLHRKTWEVCSPLPVNSASGSFIAGDRLDLLPGNDIYYVAGASSCYLYNADEDGWLQIPNSGIAGSFAAGACGYMSPIGMLGGASTSTATAGTTTTITTNRTITRNLKGHMIRCVGGANVGYFGVIANNTLGANSVVTVYNPAGAAFNATSVIQFFTGSLWFMNAGSTSVGFSVYDKATNAWTAKSVTNLPTAWGTDGCLIFTPSVSAVSTNGTATAGGVNTLTDSAKALATNQLAYCEILITGGTGIGQSNVIVSNTATVLTMKTNWTTQPDTTSTYTVFYKEQGIATAATSTTLTDGGKSWTASQFINYQVRITGGTGIGQVRTITANTATQLTVAAWTVTPDTTSTYVVEGNDDNAYLSGNADVTLYKYSVGANTWATLTPGAARSGAPGAGASFSWINEINNADWYGKGNPVAQRQNGRYLYSFRGGSTATLDIYDIAANTWVSGYAYGNQKETFTTGSSWSGNGRDIFGQLNATGRYFRFDVLNNRLVPITANPYTQSTAVVGCKVGVLAFPDDQNNVIFFLYSQLNSSNGFFRMLLI